MESMDAIILRNFLAIADCGSITAAAVRLGVAQPSLSQQLLRLEDQLGAKLFERNARGVMLTEGGRVFQEHARNILMDIERAREDVRGASSRPSGNVSIGLPLSISLLLGVPLILSTRAHLPNVAVTIEEAMSGHIREWIESGSIDLAILYNAKALRHLSVKPLAVEHLCLVGQGGEFGRAGDFGLAADPIELNDVATPRLILPSRQHGLRQFLEAASPGIADNVIIEVDSLLHIKTLVAEGHGHTILSPAAIYDDLAANRLSAARLNGSNFNRCIDIVRNPTQIVTRASIEVDDLATSLIRSMVSKGMWSLAQDDLMATAPESQPL